LRTRILLPTTGPKTTLGLHWEFLRRFRKVLIYLVTQGLLKFSVQPSSS